MSILNIKKKILFIHVPKTGGTSIEKTGLFGRPIIRHQTLEVFYKMFENDGRNLDDFFKFAFVRNPLTRTASGILNHVINKDIGRREFNEWIVQNQYNLDYYLTTRPQHKFIEVNGEIGVDFIGKMENMQEDWGRLCEILEIKAELGHFNNSERAYDLYSSETEEIIREYYKKDFELFGYEN